MRFQPRFMTLFFIPGVWFANTPVQADTRPVIQTETGLKSGWTDPESAWRGGFPGLRPGANPSNPNTYPFLPAGQPAPKIPVRHSGGHPLGINLAAHLPYTVTTEFPDEYWREAEKGYPDSGQLTDGRLGSLAFTDPAWIGYQYQYVHDVTVDLLHPSQVQAFTLDFLQNLGAGVVFPDQVKYLVSQDGVHFAVVGTIQSPERSEDYRPQSYAYELVTKPISARFVRAEFVNKVWAFMDEFAVYGTPGLNPKLAMPFGTKGTTGATNEVGYASASAVQSGGIHNIVLVYTHGHGTLGTWSQDDFKPLIEPLQRGKPRHPLFDAVLFTPYRLKTSADAWTDWLHDLFGPDTQLHGLDAAMDAQLHSRGWRWRPGKRTERVVITIPTIEDASAFGRIGIGTKSLCLNAKQVGERTAMANRDLVVAWYLAQVQQQWRQAHFHHLELIGFAWQPESLSAVNPDDAIFVQRTAEQVHRKGLRLMWIPFYGAIGIPDWRELGFDCIMIQPGVSFHWNLDPIRRLAATDKLARRYGTGLEMEAHWDVTSAYRTLANEAQRRYFSYFSAGRSLGYQDYDVVKAWYVNSKTLLTAYRSRSPFYRRVYDYTVRFIEGGSNLHT